MNVAVRVYSKVGCPYCDYAKQLLNTLAIPFEEVRVDQDPAALEFMMTASGRRTVPQIFIHGEPIGGFDDLSALHERGALMPLIHQQS